MLKFLLKLAFSSALILWLVISVDVATLGTTIFAADLRLIVAALFVLLALSVVQAIRWAFVARMMDIRVPFLTNWGIILIGQFFNQAAPSTIGGDAMRVYKLKKRGFSVGQALNSVVLDRYVAYLALMMLVAAGQPWLISEIGGGPLSWGVPIVMALGVLAGFAVPTIDLIPLPRRFRKLRVVAGIEEFSENARRVLSTAKCIVPTLSIAFAGQIAIASTAFLFAAAIDLPVSYGQILVLFPLVFLLSMLPVSVAGWGVREGAMVTALGLVGVEPAGALALSVLFGVATAVSSLPGGVVWLVHGVHTSSLDEGDGAAPPHGSGSALSAEDTNYRGK